MKSVETSAAATSATVEEKPRFRRDFQAPRRGPGIAFVISRSPVRLRRVALSLFKVSDFTLLEKLRPVTIQSPYGGRAGGRVRRRGAERGQHQGEEERWEGGEFGASHPNLRPVQA